MENRSVDWRYGLQVLTCVWYEAQVQLYPLLNKADWVTGWLSSVDSIRRMASGTQLSSLAQVHCLNKAMAGRPRYVIDGVGNLDIGITHEWKFALEIKLINDTLWCEQMNRRQEMENACVQVRFSFGLTSYLLTDELLPGSGMNATPWQERSLNGTTFVSLIHFLWHKTLKITG